MRLNIRLIGLLFGILLLAVVGRGLIYSGGRRGSRRRDGGGGQIVMLGIALILVGYIGVFFGRLIQAAVSRQREYLADAAAVQFTRNPDGIAGALKKIGAAGSRLAHPHAQEASHLFFATGMRKSVVGLLSTHPPLPDRIRRIDPAFDGHFPELSGDGPPPSLTADDRGAAVRHGVAEPSHAPIKGLAGASGSAMLASIGSPQPEHVAFAARLLESLPHPVRQAAHDPNGAVALLLALLLHRDGAAASAQREAIERLGGPTLSRRVEELARLTSSLGAAARLPLLDILLPALREGDLSPSQIGSVYGTAEAMVEADGRTDMFELAVLHVLRRQLVRDGRRGGAAADGDGTVALESSAREVGAVLSSIAWSGTADERAAASAFAAGVNALPELAGRLTMQPRGAVTIEKIDSALERLRTAGPIDRRRLIAACVRTVAHDDVVGAEEGETLRAIAEALDAPMPPGLAGSARS
jgi:hypothetical protein